MKSPIYHHKPMSLTIDLSKLVEVSDARFIHNTNGLGWCVTFQYRYSEGEPIKCTRGLKKEELSFDIHWRNILHKRKGDPLEKLPTDAELLELGYEMREDRNDDLKVLGYVLFKNEDGKPWCEINLQKEVDELIEAWTKWKEIEPEVYAIIRKHLS